MVSLWDMLSLFSVSAGLSGALARASIARAGPLTVIACCALGLVIGILWVFATRKIANRMFGRIGPEPSRKENLLLYAMYISAGIGIVVVAFLSYQTAALIA